VAGADGETHQGIFDLSFLTSIPNLTIVAPKDTDELKQALEFSLNFHGPLAIRYPRTCTHKFTKQEKFTYGKWQILQKGDGKTAVLCVGERAIAIAFDAQQKLKAKGIALTIVNCAFVKPLDSNLLSTMSDINVITIEDNLAIGGFGSLVKDYFATKNTKVYSLAYPDTFIPQGTVGELMDEFGVSDKALYDLVLSIYEN
jgi:1-deoxy-D-xylulose-5-phosphate synthase